MLLEQEIASIIAFALHHADNPSPYYYDVPECFQYPAMYFPQPEIITGGETFRTYWMRYAWYINVMCATTEDAHEKAWKVLTALKKRRNLVPLIGEDGKPDGKGLRLYDPTIQPIDTGVVQISLEWTSRRPYDDEAVEKMVYFEVDEHVRGDAAAIEAAVERALRLYENEKST